MQRNHVISLPDVDQANERMIGSFSFKLALVVVPPRL